MTPILPVHCTTRRSYAQLVIGLILGAALTLAAIPATLKASAEKSAFDLEFMRSACMFPQQDGAAVTWARADGKIFCWELK